jgi:hypothetical protein
MDRNVENPGEFKQIGFEDVVTENERIDEEKKEELARIGRAAMLAEAQSWEEEGVEDRYNSHTEALEAYERGELTDYGLAQVEEFYNQPEDSQKSWKKEPSSAAKSYVEKYRPPYKKEPDERRYWWHDRD